MSSAEMGTQRGAQMKGDMLMTVVLNIFKWFGEFVENNGRAFACAFGNNL